MTETSAHQTSAGIEALIARLRQEGVDEGQTEAARIVQKADARARAILEKAEAQAAEILEAATKNATNLRKGGEEALRAAMRDAFLDMKDEIGTRFADRISGMVTALTCDQEILRGLVLAVAGRSRTESGLDSAAAVEIELPRRAIGLDDLRRAPEDLEEGSLAHFVAAAAADLLREGITFSRSATEADGIRIRLKEEGLVIDLSDKAVADVILSHLQPRFRALLEGVVS